jgi:hypothetical protein
MPATSTSSRSDSDLLPDQPAAGGGVIPVRRGPDDRAGVHADQRELDPGVVGVAGHPDLAELGAELV